LATKATLLDDWMLDFLSEFWFEPLPGVHHANWSIGVCAGLIMWRWYWLVPERSLYHVF